MDFTGMTKSPGCSTRNSKPSNSSSSESSEDEEELMKIKAAICDDSVFQLYAQTKQIAPLNTKNGHSMGSANAVCKSSHQGQELPTPSKALSLSRSSHTTAQMVNRSQMQFLPSNRPQDKNDEEENSYSVLHTTPEFRAHVAKKLSELLEEQLADKYSSAVWKYTKKKQPVNTGIRLYSDSTGLSTGVDPSPSDGQAPSKATPARSRKHRLSTSSSESSDDERIKACVFTVSDIQQENKLLSNAAGPEREEKLTVSQEQVNHCCPLDTSSSKTSEERTKKKKKKLKKKHLKEDAAVK